MRNIIFASGNKGKVDEVKDIFKDSGYRIISLYDLGRDIDIPETGNTFSENAFIKAKAIYDMFGEPTIADDSGLEIEQLDGRPGVISARYAGEGCTFDDNNNKVIAELEGKTEPHKAKFVSCALYYDGKNKFETFGELPGVIIKEKRGTGGFGYDPIFVPDGFDITISEMGFEKKNGISHRARSFNKLKEKLTGLEINK